MQPLFTVIILIGIKYVFQGKYHLENISKFSLSLAWSSMFCFVTIVNVLAHMWNSICIILANMST